MNGVRLAAMMALALGAAACSTYRGPAPVEERARASKAPATKPAAAAAQAAKPAAASATDGFYTVKQGDTLYSIALDHGADYREVAQWNALDDPTKLRIGQVQCGKFVPGCIVSHGAQGFRTGAHRSQNTHFGYRLGHCQAGDLQSRRRAVLIPDQRKALRDSSANHSRIGQPVQIDRIKPLPVIDGQAHRSFTVSAAGQRRIRSFGLDQRPQKRAWTIQPRQRVDRPSFGIQDVVNAVAGDRAFQFASVAKIDRDVRRRADGLPVQDEAVAQDLRDRRIRIKHGAEETTVRATEFLVQVSQQSQ